MKSRKGSEFVFDYVQLLYYKCHLKNPNCGGSYIASSEWIRNKKTTKNLIIRNDNKCLQYAATVPLNHEEIKKNPQRREKNKTFINKYNREVINFPSEEGD